MSSPFNQPQVLSLSGGGERQSEAARTGSLEKPLHSSDVHKAIKSSRCEPEGFQGCANWCSYVGGASCTRHPLEATTSLQHQGPGRRCNGGQSEASIQIGPSNKRLPWRVWEERREGLRPRGKQRVGLYQDEPSEK